MNNIVVKDNETKSSTNLLKKDTTSFDNIVNVDFKLKYITIYKNGNTNKIIFNDHYNDLLLSKQNNMLEIINLVKLCLTGKNDHIGHLREKGIEVIELGFNYESSEYIIRIFSEHQYKSFFIKVSENYNKEKIENVIKTCIGMKEYHNYILPIIQKFLNIPDYITLPQFLRFFYLNDETSLQRIISEKGYEQMTSILMEYIVNKSIEEYKTNYDYANLLNNYYNDKLMFVEYYIKFIEDKIDKLNKQEELEIETVKINYRKEINNDINLKIKENKTQIKKALEEELLLKRKFTNLKKTLKHLKNYDSKNQLTLFGEQESKDEEKNAEEQLNIIEHNLIHIKLKIDYLSSTIEDLKKLKLEIIKKYKEKIMNIISDFRGKVLLERIELENLNEEKQKIIYENSSNNLTNSELKALIIKIIESTINKYINKLNLESSIKLSENFYPIIVDKAGKSISYENLNTSEKSLIALSFHLGLMDYSLNCIKVFPSLLVVNLINEATNNLYQIENIIKRFRLNNRDKNIQIIVIKR